MKFFNKFSSIISCCKDTSLIILNADKELNLKVDEQAKYYNSDLSKIVKLLYTNCEKLNATASTKKFVILIIGYTSLNRSLIELKAEDPTVKTLDELIKMIVSNS